MGATWQHAYVNSQDHIAVIETGSVSELPAEIVSQGDAVARDVTVVAVDNGESDVVIAVRNATKLGLSLMGTWGIALVVRVFLPRRLGPSLFGAYQFADSFTNGLFILGSLGIETYVRKELATRREQASEFFGGVALLRIGITIVLAVGSILFLAHAGKPLFVLQLVAIFSIAQYFILQNATFAAMLHAVGEVTELSLLSIATKLMWGVGIIVGLLVGGRVIAAAIAVLISEVIKAIGLARLSRRHLALRLRFNAVATKTAVMGSLPYYVAGLSQTVYATINISALSFLANDTEVGWYGAASSVANMAMLLSPLLSWVLIPLIARAEARSAEALRQLTQQAMSVTLSVAIPVTLILALGADVIVHRLFGAAFDASTMSLRVMAPVFVFTYVAIVSGGALVGQGRGWVATAVLSVGLVLSPLLNWWLIPHGAAYFGPGGAGVGAAAALNITEATIAFGTTYMLRDPVLDKLGRMRLLKTLGVCLVVIALDRLALQSLGVVRLVTDALVYALLAVATKAVDYHMLLSVIRRARTRRGDIDAAIF